MRKSSLSNCTIRRQIHYFCIFFMLQMNRYNAITGNNEAESVGILTFYCGKSIPWDLQTKAVLTKTFLFLARHKGLTMNLWILSLNLYIIKSANRWLCIAASRFSVGGGREGAKVYGPEGVEKRRNPLRNVIFYPSCFVTIVMSKKIQITLQYLANIFSRKKVQC